MAKHSSRNLVCYGMIALFILAIVFFNSYTKSSARESFTNSPNDCVVRMFYVNWCGHCKTTKPEFQQFMEQNNNKEINGKNVKIEMIYSEASDADKQLAAQFGVKSYPTIIAQVNGKQTPFEGGERTAAGFDNWLQSLLQ